MLKKAISFSIVLLLLFLSYQFLINFLKNEHHVSYTINKEETYKIEESYYKNNDDFYILKVTTKDNNEFIFETNNNFNKQKEIVKDVIDYKKDNVECLLLIFKDKDKRSDPVCRENNILTSYNYVKNKYDFSEFIKQIPNYDLNKYNENSKEREESDIYIYPDYLEEDETVIVYSYKKIGFFNKGDSKYLTFSTNDNYKNILGSLVGKYYVIPFFTSNATITKYIKYDVTSGIHEDIDLTYKLSKQTYINGVYNNKLYIFDKSSLKQYALDPYREELTLIGDENTNGFAYINGEQKEISVYDLNNETVKFSDNKDSYSELKYQDIYISSRYAIIFNDGKFYKVYKDNVSNPILLFEENDAKEIKLNNDSIYYIKDDSIYRYNKYGNVKLVTRNELKYNFENVYDIYIK